MVLSQQRVELSSLGFACSFGSTEVKKLFDFFMRMWLDMPKVIENKLVISQKYT